MFVDAFTFTKHLHWQDVPDFKQHLASHFFLNPIGVHVFWPIIDAFNIDMFLVSEFSSNQQVYIRLTLLLSQQHLVVIEDALLGKKKQIFQSCVLPGIEWTEIFPD